MSISVSLRARLLHARPKRKRNGPQTRQRFQMVPGRGRVPESEAFLRLQQDTSLFGWPILQAQRKNVMAALLHPSLHGDVILHRQASHWHEMRSLSRCSESQVRTCVAYLWQLESNIAYPLWVLADPSLPIVIEAMRAYVVYCWRRVQLSRGIALQVLADLAEEAWSRLPDELPHWKARCRHLPNQLRAVARGIQMSEGAIYDWPYVHRESRRQYPLVSLFEEIRHHCLQPSKVSKDSILGYAQRMVLPSPGPLGVLREGTLRVSDCMDRYL